MMAASTPVVEISCEDDTWNIKTSTLIRTTELKFKAGEEYVETMPSGQVLNVGNFILIHVSEGHNPCRLSSCRLDFRSSMSSRGIRMFSSHHCMDCRDCDVLWSLSFVPGR